MEDFGFKKNNEPKTLSFVSKKILLFSATLFSIACFIYITISAYYYIYEDKNSNIEVIEAEPGEIKSYEKIKENNESFSSQIDHSIYEDIFGNKKARKPALNAVKQIEKPAMPPKQIITENNPIKSVDDEIKVESKIEEKVAKAPEPKSRGRSVRVQVAAMTSKESANNAWKALRDVYPKLFNNLKPYIHEVDLGKRGIFYRLQIGEFFNQVEAEEFCRKYILASNKSRSDCILVE